MSPPRIEVNATTTELRAEQRETRAPKCGVELREERSLRKDCGNFFDESNRQLHCLVIHESLGRRLLVDVKPKRAEKVNVVTREARANEEENQDDREPASDCN